MVRYCRRFNIFQAFSCNTGYAANKTFGKICPKAIRATFFPLCGLSSGQGRVTEGNIQQKEKFKRLAFQRDSLRQFSPFAWNPDLSIRKILKSGLLTVMILKRVVRIFSFKATNLQRVMLDMKKRWQILWWDSVYWRLPIDFKVRNI